MRAHTHTHTYIWRWRMVVERTNLQINYWLLKFMMTEQNSRHEERYGGIFECGEERGMLERCRDGRSERWSGPVLLLVSWLFIV